MADRIDIPRSSLFSVSGLSHLCMSFLVLVMLSFCYSSLSSSHHPRFGYYYDCPMLGVLLLLGHNYRPSSHAPPHEIYQNVRRDWVLTLRHDKDSTRLSTCSNPHGLRLTKRGLVWFNVKTALPRRKRDCPRNLLISDAVPIFCRSCLFNVVNLLFTCYYLSSSSVSSSFVPSVHPSSPSPIKTLRRIFSFHQIGTAVCVGVKEDHL